MTRLFGLRDVLTIRQLQTQGVAFDLRRQLLFPPLPLRSALAGYLSSHHLGTLTCVHSPSEETGGISGFAQVWPRAIGVEWDLSFLSPSLTHQSGAGPVWLRLLSDLIVLGAEQGVARIYAQTVEDAETEDILRQVGYTMLNREEVFVVGKPPAPAPLPKGLRALRPEDQPALAELYARVVPQLVRHTDGLPSFGAGDCRPAYRSSIRRFIWIDKGHVMACFGLCQSARGCWMEAHVRPECRADVLPHLRYLLTLTHCSTISPVYCPVPDYGVGVGWLLRTLGFETYGRQALMVAHTMARAPVRRRVLVSGLERSVDVSTTVGHVCRGKTPS